MKVFSLIIGDGSLYQKVVNKLSGLQISSANINAFLEAMAFPVDSGCSYGVETAVRWHDGAMFVDVNLRCKPDDLENEQPDIRCFFTMHDWQAVVARVKSQRRELEGRTAFGANDDCNDVGDVCCFPSNGIKPCWLDTACDGQENPKSVTPSGGVDDEVDINDRPSRPPTAAGGSAPVRRA